jgi:pyrimidine-specific ribonucleoside hydrolase
MGSAGNGKNQSRQAGGEGMREEIILDVDTGHDDAVAICLACAANEVKVLGITTVAGNSTVDNTTDNTLKVLTLLKETNVPVARGCHKPLIRPLVTAENIHGKSGLDGAELPSPQITPIKMHAVNFLIDTLRTHDNPITIVATAPLTNIALMFALAPDIALKIKRIVLMGGAICGGNRSACAEFNIYVDPEAAKIVFESGVPITMVGLDVTEKTVLMEEEIRKLFQSETFQNLMLFYAQRRAMARGLAGAVFHDAVAVASVIDPDLLRTEALPVAVEIGGSVTRGMTVVDRRAKRAELIGNIIDVAVDIDVSRFKEILSHYIKTLGI